MPPTNGRLVHGRLLARMILTAVRIRLHTVPWCRAKELLAIEVKAGEPPAGLAWRILGVEGRT